MSFALETMMEIWAQGSITKLSHFQNEGGITDKKSKKRDIFIFQPPSAASPAVGAQSFAQ